ncbi:hypothetical protein BG006_010984 [Podila minutissima]|uniref:BTB domain-containing protein n=1 Tax=Podila minutissima TaxID=64525 RepID=A0A9P5VI89_9FUNG|nr:hypothetical protein BG006_010984 [Podila minutissima]
MAFGDAEIAPCVRTLEFSIEVSATSLSTSKYYDVGMKTILRLTVGSLGQCSGFQDIVLAKDIPLDKLEVINGRFKVVVRLSNQEYVPAPSKYAALDSAASFLERLYHDVHGRDVSFIVNNPHLEAANEITVERAHKLVLNQWPYFKRMFSSDFMEGGAGEKEIQVKDVKPQVFQLLLRFMYTGTIPQEKHPSTTFADTLTDPQEVCWEDLFLAAHRYELDELCEFAQNNMLENLTPEAAIPFLFRTGYLFDSLRAPSIKFIASTSASHVANNAFRVEFSFEWPVPNSTSPDTMSESFASNMDSFDFNVAPEIANTDRFAFWVSPRPTFAKSYILKSPNGSYLASGPLLVREGFYGGVVHQLLNEKIPRNKLQVVNDRYVMEVCLSSREYIAPVPEPAPTAPVDLEPVAPTPAASFLERLYHDVTNRDVSFIFNTPDLEATYEEIVIEKAHKLVLDQWPYFQRMLNGNFKEGVASEKEIEVLDVKPKVFQLLIRFMYTGTIPEEEHPSATLTDTLADPQEASWEDVFLAAHHYELDELCELAQKNIPDKLTPQTAIPFLFRTGYLFDALRAPTIKYIAATCVSEAASKSFRDMYHNHPEYGKLVFEIFEEFHYVPN